MDVLARQNAAHPMARYARRERAVGQAWLHAAWHHRDRPAAVPDPDRLLRLSLPRDRRHSPRPPDPPGTIGRLPLLCAVSRLLAHAGPRRFTGRGAPHGGATCAAGGGVRQAVLAEVALATMIMRRSAGRAGHIAPS